MNVHAAVETLDRDGLRVPIDAEPFASPDERRFNELDPSDLGYEGQTVDGHDVALAQLGV